MASIVSAVDGDTPFELSYEIEGDMRYTKEYDGEGGTTVRVTGQY